MLCLLPDVGICWSSSKVDGHARKIAGVPIQTIYDGLIGLLPVMQSRSKDTVEWGCGGFPGNHLLWD